MLATLQPATCQAWDLVANSSGGLRGLCASCVPAGAAPATPRAAAPAGPATPGCLSALNLPGSQVLPPFEPLKRQYVARIPRSLPRPWLFVELAPGGGSSVATTCWDSTALSSPPPIAAEATGGGLRFALPTPAETGTVCEVLCARGATHEVYTLLLAPVEAVAPQPPAHPGEDGMDEDGPADGGMALGGGGVLFILLLCTCGACCWLAHWYSGDSPLKRGSRLLASIDGGAGSDSGGVLGF